jgi:MFS family permease
VSAAYTQFAIFAGPALAGWILVRWGVAAAFFTNVVGYVVYFASTFFLVTPPHYQQARPGKKSIREDVLVGMSYVTRHKGLSALLMLILAGDSISNAIYKLMPAYSSDVLSMGTGAMSALYGAAGLGATLAALWLAHGGAPAPRRGRFFGHCLVSRCRSSFSPGR